MRAVCFCAVCVPVPSLRSVASLGSELLELQKLQDTEWTTVGSGGSAWEVGSTQRGVVSFWNQGAGWGKIKVSIRTTPPPPPPPHTFAALALLCLWQSM